MAIINNSRSSMSVDPAFPTSRSSTTLAQTAQLPLMDSSASEIEPSFFPTSNSVLSLPLLEGTDETNSFDISDKSSPQLEAEAMSKLSFSRSETLESSIDLRVLWSWILCICVVNFDLELGQALEVVYPPINLSANEKKTISFSAFPDSNSSAHLGDSLFSFRMRSGTLTNKLYRNYDSIAVCDILSNTGYKWSSSQSIAVASEGYTYGYVFFRQQRDSKIRRGFFQKSLVILTPHPWRGLFATLLSILGPQIMATFNNDSQRPATPDSIQPFSTITALQQACLDISLWPLPPLNLGSTSAYHPIEQELPFLNHKLSFSIPPNPRFPQLFKTLPIPRISSSSIQPRSSSLPLYSMHDPSAPIVASPGKFYENFSRSLETLWTCWELMILGEPVLVLSETPKGCSDVVWGLVEIIKPVPYGGDFRPYFTIQDSDFKAIVSPSKTVPTATVVGATNSMFGKALQHWPHIITVVRSDQLPSSTSPIRNPTPAQNNVVLSDTFGSKADIGNMILRPSSPGLARTESRSSSPSGSISGKSSISKDNWSKSPGSSLLSSFSRGKTSGVVASGVGYATSFGASDSGPAFPNVVQNLASKHKPFFLKDKKVMKEVVETAIRGAPHETLDNTIRRHFIELTDRFMQPLNRYFDGLVVGSPVELSLSQLRSKPEIVAFKQDVFLKTIETSSPSLPIQSRRPIVEFYRAFLKSPNFGAWMQFRSMALQREWTQQYLAVLADSDIKQWASARGRQEIELVDLLLRLRQEITKYDPVFSHNPASAHHNDSILGGAYIESLGFIPSKDHYEKLKSQEHLLLLQLPDSIKQFHLNS